MLHSDDGVTERGTIGPICDLVVVRCARAPPVYHRHPRPDKQTPRTGRSSDPERVPIGPVCQPFGTGHGRKISCI